MLNEGEEDGGIEHVMFHLYHGIKARIGQEFLSLWELNMLQHVRIQCSTLWAVWLCNPCLELLSQ